MDPILSHFGYCYSKPHLRAHFYFNNPKFKRTERDSETGEDATITGIPEKLVSPKISAEEEQQCLAANSRWKKRKVVSSNFSDQMAMAREIKKHKD
jgi:hypothetical protein